MKIKRLLLTLGLILGCGGLFAGAVTKLKVFKSDSTEVLRVASLEGEILYSCYTSLTDVVKVQFVRINPNDDTDIWNYGAENTDLTKNYCNLYDNGGGNNFYSCLKFESIGLDNNGETEQCADNYANANATYNGLSTAQERLDVLSVPLAAARLKAWAAANNDVIDEVNGDVISFARSTVLLNDSNDSIIMIMSLAVFSFVALSSLLLIKKRKHH